MNLLFKFTLTELKNRFKASSDYEHCVCWREIIVDSQHSLYLGRKQQLIVIV